MVAAKRRYWNGTVTIGGGSGAAYADYIVSTCSSSYSLKTANVIIGRSDGSDLPSSA
jgi:hypothetical protein